ncbi:MAG: hypothetical protein HC925_09720 [Coleofasciculaceae cyanobacterium SM2_3_26]|nr:hypothetical protein [Coleofasciculaceae cyanobacterium SM2_3_26]
MRTRRKIQQLIREQMSDERRGVQTYPWRSLESSNGLMQPLAKELILGWEAAHRSDRHRTRRKREQLIVDWIAFVFSGIASVLAFWVLVPQPPFLVQLLSLGEFALLMVLGIEIFVYADWQEGK